MNIELDVNQTGHSGSAPIPGYVKLGIFVFKKSGRCENNIVGLEISPDNENWLPFGPRCVGEGAFYTELVANYVRARVYKADGEPSVVEIHTIVG